MDFIFPYAIVVGAFVGSLALLVSLSACGVVALTGYELFEPVRASRAWRITCAVAAVVLMLVLLALVVLTRVPH